MKIFMVIMTCLYMKGKDAACNYERKPYPTIEECFNVIPDPAVVQRPEGGTLVTFPRCVQVAEKTFNEQEPPPSYKPKSFFGWVLITALGFVLAQFIIPVALLLISIFLIPFQKNKKE